ncbi:MAG: transpeptidase family protein [Alistipes sp.]|nr:transpeptidase family protein [Alistipes sp.]
MEKSNNKIYTNTMRRLKVLYALLVVLLIVICGRIVQIQFLSPETNHNARLIHSNRQIIKRDTLYAHRGSILARDGRPLATSIFRYRVTIDFGSEGFELSRKQFQREADSLSKMLARFFGDKPASEYYKRMVAEHERCFRYETEREAVPYSRGLFAQLFKIRNACDTCLKQVPRHRQIEVTGKDGAKRMVNIHREVQLFRDVDINEWQVLRTFPILCRASSVCRVKTVDSRIYPYENLAMRSIGRSDEYSRYGIEHVYREKLAGTGGYRWMRCVAPGFYTSFSDKEHQPLKPTDGAEIHTTIDIDVQQVAEKALRQRINDVEATWGTTVVMECATGDVLAMVNLSRNSKGQLVENKNHVLGARTEPGSTFKLAATLALLDDAHFNPDTKYGYDKVKGKKKHKGVRFEQAKKTITDSHYIEEAGKGVLDLKKAFMESSNIYFTKAVWECYKDNPLRYSDYLCALHLDRRVGFEEFGEATPLIPRLDKKHPSRYNALVNMAYGYVVELAPIQTLTLYNAIANGGRMVAPRLISHITRDGEVVERFEPQPLLDSAICTPATLAKVREYMEATALEGTGKGDFGANKCPFRVGLKTGTAQYAQSGISHDDGHYIASMVTYLPAENPRYTFITVMYTTSRKHYYGAGLAGPVQKQVATFLYNRNTSWSGTVTSTEERPYLPEQVKGGNISHIRTVANKLDLRSSTEVRNGWGTTRNGEEPDKVGITPIEEAQHLMPDVEGMGLADALYILESRGLKVSFSGRGKVCSQSIRAGATIKGGERVTLKLK